MPLNQNVEKFINQTRPLLIGDRWLETDEVINVINPSDGEKIAEVYSAGHKEVDAAVAAARQAFESPAWKRMPPAERTALLYRLADLLEQNGEELLEMEILNEGMPISIAKHFIISGCAETIRYYAGWATKISGSTVNLSLPDERGSDAFGPAYHAFSVKEPIGVVAAITPWNMQLIIAIAKLAPALAAGCTLVVKPADLTPLTTLRLGELILEAGFPAGVVNIIPGYGLVAGQALADHMDVDKIAFTGSTATGKSIVSAAATSNLKKVALELGGKSPVLVFPDADLDQAAQTCAEGIFLNSGQMCFAGSRLIVHESIEDEIVGRIVEGAQSMKIGPGLDESSDLGPMISRLQKSRVEGFFKKEMLQNADVIIGGNPLNRDGFYFEPTLVKCDDPNSPLVKQEIFGPVLTIQTFKNVEEACALANDTDFGLCAGVWTQSNALAHQVSAEIKSGVIWSNCYIALDESLPFGGYKQSGWGREGSIDGVEAFLQTKSVVMGL